MKLTQLSILGLSIIAAGASNAATVISSAFDNNTGAFALTGNADNTSGAGNSLSVTWTGDEFASGSSLQSISPGGGFAIVNGSPEYSNNNVAYINHNMNISDRAAARGYSFTFTSTVDYDLTGLIVRSGHTNNTAISDQAFDSDLTVSISGGVFSNTQTVDYDTTPAIKTLNYDLTGNSLQAGIEYTVTVTSANMPGGGAYMVYDGITLEGTAAVPEPGTSALLGLGGISLILRRRK